MKSLLLDLCPAVQTGYGYLELLDGKPNSDGVCRVRRFHEKPTRERAEQMISTLQLPVECWYLFVQSKIYTINAFKKLHLKLFLMASDAVNKSKADLDLRLDPESWASLESKSIDYCIMEKLHNLIVVPYSSRWTDLGGWNLFGPKVTKTKMAMVSKESF